MAAILLIAMYVYLLVPEGLSLLLKQLAPEAGEAYRQVQLTVFAICLVVLLVAGIVNVFSSLRLYKGGKYNKLRGAMKVAKLGSIPFFIAEFVILLLMAVGFSALALFFLWTIGGPIALMVLLGLAALFIYAVLLCSSASAIAFIALLRKEGTLNLALTVIYIVMQLVPVADVIATLMLLSRYKKRPEQATFVATGHPAPPQYPQG